jgi:hypothetical protein
MRKTAPTGKEISEAAKSIRLDNNKTVEGTKNGKKVKFTGVTLPAINSLEEFENGHVIGILENELEGDETKLPPGRHNVHLSCIEGIWRAFAESGGEIRAEAIRVTVEKHHMWEKKGEKPVFKGDGWCIWVCLWPVPIPGTPFFWCLWSTWICW